MSGDSLPAGFTLDAPAATGLPPGFTLDPPPATVKRSATVASNAGAEAVAGIPDMLLNAPNNLLNLGRAGIGTLATLAGRNDLAPELTPNPDLVRRGFKSAGFINDELAPKTPAEQRIAALSGGAVGGVASPTRSIPQMLGAALVGSASGEAGNEVKSATGNDALGISASLLTPSAIQNVGDRGRNSVRAAELRESQRRPMEDTRKEVRAAGYVMPPSMTNPTMTNRILESFGGKIATQQEASLRNEGVTADQVRANLRAPASMGITEDALSTLSNQRAQPYRDVAAVPGLPARQTGTSYSVTGEAHPIMGATPLTPAQALHELNQVRIDAKDHWREFQRQGSVAARDQYRAASARAAQLETEIEAAAVAQGRPELVPQLRAARTDIAKIHDVDRALNTDRGEVSALDFAKARDRGVPLTGELLTVAKMGNAYPKAVQRPEQIGSPAVNNLVSGLSAAGGGGIGAAMGGAMGAGAGAAAGAIGVPIAQSLARKLLLSSPYQNYMGAPNYRASLLNRGTSALPNQTQEQQYIRALIGALQQAQ